MLPVGEALFAVEMLTDVIVEEDFDRNEDDMWYSRKDLEHGKTHSPVMLIYHVRKMVDTCAFHEKVI